MLGDDEAGDRPTFPDDPSIQHGHLAGLLARLKAIVSAEHEPRQVFELLHVLLTDVRQHFAAEEHTMDRLEYPLLEEHRERHSKFLRHLETVETETRALKAGLSAAVATQLENWFHDHEQTADADLLAYLRSNR
ncbi:MAG: hemerythrin family protein [Myxococcales bacterium]|nr:hemerythrin family protein [Myxococcales bacterium]